MLAAGLVLGLGLGAAAATCDNGSSTPNSEDDRESTSATSAEEGSGESEEEKAAGEGNLPGGIEPGEREPKAPGPDGVGVFFLAGLKGYLEPCGCTADVMLGGAERLVGYVEAAGRLYDGRLMLDVGDTLFETREIEEHSVAQEKAKIEVVLEMHRSFGTRATVPGERDFALGIDFYRDSIEELDATVLGANLELAGEELPGVVTESVEDWEIAVVGAADPSLYEGIEGVDVSAMAPAVGEALESVDTGSVDSVVALVHGDLKAAKELLDAEERIDFAVVGHDPRETDAVDRVGNGYTLEAYDQGRYLGVLKLFGADGERPFENVRTGSESELEQIDRQIEHVEESIEELPPAPPDDAPPILQRLRDRLADLEERRREIKSSDLDVPEDRRSFLYRSVPMKPGFPVDTKIRSQRTAYNRKLKELNKEIERTVPSVSEGEPTYVGTQACTSCHAEAHEFWEGTLHAEAMQTLEEREKDWDGKCVRCHVVGYEKPGGSVLGKLEYEAEVDGSTVTKDLRDVGCEACHGPGSKHRASPVGSDGTPRHIESGGGESTCMECHVEEHSPRFNYETYVKEITGEGHPLGEGAN